MLHLVWTSMDEDTVIIMFVQLSYNIPLHACTYTVCVYVYVFYYI